MRTSCATTQGFNSRSREGSDRTSKRLKRRCTSFNSRSREGSDSQISISLSMNSVFQFTLPRGERLYPFLYLLCCVSFNSRSREGSD